MGTSLTVCGQSTVICSVIYYNRLALGGTRANLVRPAASHNRTFCKYQHIFIGKSVSEWVWPYLIVQNVPLQNYNNKTIKLTKLTVRNKTIYLSHWLHTAQGPPLPTAYCYNLT